MTHSEDPQPVDNPGDNGGLGVNGWGHRPLSLRHSIRMADAASKGAVRLAAIHALVEIPADRPVARTELNARLRDAQAVSHDRVIEAAGAGRLTGVVWCTLQGQAAVDFLRDAQAAEDPGSPMPFRRPADAREHDDLIEILERSPASVLICATALVDARVSKAMLS